MARKEWGGVSFSLRIGDFGVGKGNFEGDFKTLKETVIFFLTGGRWGIYIGTFSDSVLRRAPSGIRVNSLLPW